MENKFIRLFKCDALLLLRVAVIGAMLVIIFVQSNILKAIGKRYAAAQAQRALVLKIKPMEQELEARRDMTAKKIVKGMLVFEGVLRDQGKFYAMIDSKVYQVGEKIRDYQITSITDDSVTLVDVRTKEQKILRMSFHKPGG